MLAFAGKRDSEEAIAKWICWRLERFDIVEALTKDRRGLDEDDDFYFYELQYIALGTREQPFFDDYLLLSNSF